jgi:hypothetical protein
MFLANQGMAKDPVCYCADYELIHTSIYWAWGLVTLTNIPLSKMSHVTKSRQGDEKYTQGFPWEEQQSLTEKGTDSERVRKWCHSCKLLYFAVIKFLYSWVTPHVFSTLGRRISSVYITREFYDLGPPSLVLDVLQNGSKRIQGNHLFTQKIGWVLICTSNEREQWIKQI